MIARAVIIVFLVAAANASAQETLTARVMDAVRAAMAQALPFPETDDAGAMPANNSTEALWMVRYPRPGEQTIEVMANPLNETNQREATRAMQLIEANIEAAQRRATAQYEQAIAEAKRTGKSQEVDGVTLSDEGLAGERIDAESRVTITVDFNQREYRFRIPGNQEPTRSVDFSHRDGIALMVPHHLYRDENGSEHYAESHRVVLLGRIAAPQTSKDGRAFMVSAAATTAAATTGLEGIALHIRGNPALVNEIAARTDWNRLLELLQ